MFSRTVRRLLVILGLAIAFYFLVSMTIARMPFTSHPLWWMSIWPSRKIGVYAWFGLLNAAGALMAGVPVALLLRWLIDRNRARAAFIVGVMTALVAIGQEAAEYSPFGRASALMTFELFLVIFLAVPLLIWVMHALPRNKSVERS